MMITQSCHPSQICKYHLVYGRFPVLSLLPRSLSFSPEIQTLILCCLLYYYFYIAYFKMSIEYLIKILNLKQISGHLSPKPVPLTVFSISVDDNTVESKDLESSWYFSLLISTKFDYLSPSPLLLPCSKRFHFSTRTVPNWFLLISFHLATHLPTESLLYTVSMVILLWPNSDHNSHLLKTSKLSLNTHTQIVKANAIQWHIQGPRWSAFFVISLTSSPTVYSSAYSSQAILASLPFS